MLQAAWVALLLTASAEKPKLVVLDLTATGGADPQDASALSDAVTQEVSSRGLFEVTSSKDVQVLLGVERRKQILGCSEEGSCLTELAGAMGARFVLSGTLAKLGSAYQLSLQTLDTKKATPVGRSTRLAKDIDTLRNQLPYSVAEATGTPLPPPPSHLVPYALIAGGGLAMVGGVLVGLHALSGEGQIQAEISLGQSARAVLKPLDYYNRQLDGFGVERTASLTAMVSGAALIGLGSYLNPSEGGGASTRVSLAPAPGGFAVVGQW